MSIHEGIHPHGNRPLATSHRFLDESGDTTFFGKGRIPILGQLGVSLSFAIGMVEYSGELGKLRASVRDLQNEVVADRYLNSIPSVLKKIMGKGGSTIQPLTRISRIFTRVIDASPPPKKLAHLHPEKVTLRRRGVGVQVRQA